MDILYRQLCNSKNVLDRWVTKFSKIWGSTHMPSAYRSSSTLPFYSVSALDKLPVLYQTNLFPGINWYCNYFVILVPIIAGRETTKSNMTNTYWSKYRKCYMLTMRPQIAFNLKKTVSIYCRQKSENHSWKFWLHTDRSLVYWPITIQSRTLKETSNPQTYFHCCLWFSFIMPNCLSLFNCKIIIHEFI